MRNLHRTFGRTLTADLFRNEQLNNSELSFCSCYFWHTIINIIIYRNRNSIVTGFDQRLKANQNN